MHLLNTIAVTVVGLMVGNELAVSVFVNPALWRLESSSQAHGLSLLARSLGRVMPVWYALCLALMAFESFLHRHQTVFFPLLMATFLWVGVIAFSITMLVPINNRIAALSQAPAAFDWKHDHKQWDFLHRIRILLLALALFVLTYALVG
jgi:uncharacterized membrane protein